MYQHDKGSKEVFSMGGRNGKMKKKIKGQITRLSSINSEPFKQTYIYLLCSKDEEFRFPNLNGIREHIHSWQILGQIKLSLLILMKKTTNQTWKYSLFQVTLLLSHKLLPVFILYLFDARWCSVLLLGLLFIWSTMDFQGLVTHCITLEEEKRCVTFQLRPSMINVFTRTETLFKSWKKTLIKSNGSWD